MDIILIIKSFLLGGIAAGSLYFTAAFAFHYFPMPVFLNLRRMALNLASKQYKKKASRGELIWSVSRVFFIVLILAVWLALIGGYLYLVHQLLPNYVPQNDPIYWYYFGVATGLPGLLAIIQFFLFFRTPKASEPSPTTDERPLLEQMQ